MIKAYFVAVTLMLISFSLSAQKKGDFLFALENGVSFPVGRFAATEAGYNFLDLHHKAVGLAKTGYQVNLSGSYLFSKNFAAVVNVGFSKNDQDGRKIIEFQLGNQIDSYEKSIETDPWKVWRYLAGLSYNRVLSSNKKFFIQAKALAGISKTEAPGYKFWAVATNGTQPSLIRGTYYGAKLDPAFSWQVNAGGGYWLNRHFFVLIDVSYFDSEPGYRWTINSPGSSLHGKEASINYKLSTIGLNATVGFRL